MSAFNSNIINIYGEKGKIWLAELPEAVASISSRLGLRDLKKVANQTYNYVLSGFQNDKPIILKLGLDNDGLKREALALKCLEGYGAVKILAVEEGMLLLERAIPGTSLKSYVPNKENESLEIACGVMKKLHRAMIPDNHYFPHIKDWLAALDKDWNIPHEYLQKARELRDQLLKTTNEDVLLHGDFHHDNILQDGEAWLVIDPKGVIGEQAYEVAAFVRNPIPEILNMQNATEIIKNRIAIFSDLLNITHTRIAEWCFVQAVLGWIWNIQDNLDTTYFERMTKILTELR